MFRSVAMVPALPQPIKSSEEVALPVARRTIELSSWAAAVVPLAPLVEGPPPVPKVLLLIVPTVINSSSTKIKSAAVMPVALSTSIAVSLLSRASANCVVNAPLVVPPH